MGRARWVRHRASALLLAKAVWVAACSFWAGRMYGDHFFIVFCRLHSSLLRRSGAASVVSLLLVVVGLRRGRAFAVPCGRSVASAEA